MYIDYTLCITQMLSRHVLFIFSFHQNGSPEIIHRERVGNSSPSLDSSTVGLRAVCQESITTTQRTFAAVGRVTAVTIFESFNKSFTVFWRCFPMRLWNIACYYLMLLTICEFQGGVHSSEASHAGNGQELRWAERGQDALVKTGWKKMLHCPNIKRVHNNS